jgi:hypothetical protein
MVVFNRSRTTAIAVRRDAKGVVLIPMSAGLLHLLHLTDAEFQKDWKEIPSGSLTHALEKFLAHAERVGATKEAREALDELRRAQGQQPDLLAVQS